MVAYTLASRFAMVVSALAFGSGDSNCISRFECTGNIGIAFHTQCTVLEVEGLSRMAYARKLFSVFPHIAPVAIRHMLIGRPPGTKLIPLVLLLPDR